jgi:protoheme ferro-lyase
MLVYAVEGYAKKHGISEQETLSLFSKHGIPHRICTDYNVAYIEHTNLDENVTYAEDIIEGRIPQRVDE